MTQHQFHERLGLRITCPKKAGFFLLPEMFLENQRTPHTSVYENNALRFEQMPAKKISFQFSVQHVGPTDYSIINVQMGRFEFSLT